MKQTSVMNIFTTIRLSHTVAGEMLPWFKLIQPCQPESICCHCHEFSTSVTQTIPSLAICCGSAWTISSVSRSTWLSQYELCCSGNPTAMIRCSSMNVSTVGIHTSIYIGQLALKQWQKFINKRTAGSTAVVVCFMGSNYKLRTTAGADWRHSVTVN